MVVGIITRESIHKVCRISRNNNCRLYIVHCVPHALHNILHALKERSRRLEGGVG